MKQYKSAVRMGALNLLVLVIALCLVVLSVLALVSANATTSFTTKQANTTTQYYAQEVAGQSFLATLNEGWDAFSARDEELTQLAIDGYMSSALGWASIDSGGIVLQGDALLVDVDDLYEQMGIPIFVRGNMAQARSYFLADDPDYCYSIASTLEECVKGVEVHFFIDEGKKLDALIGLKRDGGIEVLQWKSTREWVPKQEQLWNPNEQDEIIEVEVIE